MEPRGQHGETRGKTLRKFRPRVSRYLEDKLFDSRRIASFEPRFHVTEAKRLIRLIRFRSRTDSSPHFAGWSVIEDGSLIFRSKIIQKATRTLEEYFQKKKHHSWRRYTDLLHSSTIFVTSRNLIEEVPLFRNIRKFEYNLLHKV